MTDDCLRQILSELGLEESKIAMIFKRADWDRIDVTRVVLDLIRIGLRKIPV